MDSVFTALDFAAAVLVAGALAMIAFAHKELKAARLMLIIAAVGIIARWEMWSFSGDYNWVIRSAVGAIVGALLLGGLPALYHWASERDKAQEPSQMKTEAPSRPLRRLIAYRGFDLIVPWSGTDSKSKFHGYNITVFNASDDTITARLMFLNADIDRVTVLSISEGAPVIIQQTTGNMFRTWRNAEDIPISLDMKAITVEFEVDYDSIPESGIRKSYRKIAYHLNWANGPNSAPLLEPQTVDEWER